MAKFKGGLHPAVGDLMYVINFGLILVGAICGEPLSGWVDNWNGATGLIYDFGRGVNKVFHGQRETITDMIPVDYIVNLAIVAATKCR